MTTDLSTTPIASTALRERICVFTQMGTHKLGLSAAGAHVFKSEDGHLSEDEPVVEMLVPIRVPQSIIVSLQPTAAD